MEFVYTREIIYMRLRCIAACFSLFFVNLAGWSQSRETKNIILVAVDGLRWQELFEGADPSIVDNEKYVDFPEEINAFGGPSEIERRKSLMPFMWNVLATQGQLYGNRDLKNKVNCTNRSEERRVGKEV